MLPFRTLKICYIKKKQIMDFNIALKNNETISRKQSNPQSSTNFVDLFVLFHTKFHISMTVTFFDKI